MSKKFRVLAVCLTLVMVFAACGQPAAPAAPPADAPAGAPAPAAPAPAAPAPAAPQGEAPAVEEATGLAAELRQHIDETHSLWSIVEIMERFPTRTDSADAPIQGGHLRFGVASDTPVPGTFNTIDQSSAIDGNFMDWFTGGSVFSWTPARTFGQYGIVNWTYDQNERSITMNMQETVYWHDGVEMTLDDLVFAIERIATPGYTGIRYTAAQRNIVGTEAFHAGETDSIEGLVLSNNNRTLKVYFYEFPPSLLHGGFWSTPHPRHIFEDIPVGEAPDHPATRLNPIGFGPFIVENIVPGESMLLRANDNFWLGRPYLDYVTVQVVATTLVPSLMLAGELDIVAFRAEDFPEYEHQATNFHFLGDVQNNFGIINFNLGDWDPETARVVPHENARMGDVRLRRAMGYALDESILTEYFFHGLRIPATSIIPPGHSRFLDFSLEGFTYDPDLARALLDEAGFIDIDGDGFREDPDGNEFTILFATRIRADWDFITPFYIQQWAEVGLRVEMYQGRQHDFAAMSENIWSADNWPDVDIFEAAWVAGFDPNPRGLWGHTVNNRSRFINAELEAILDNISSDRAWDTDWLIQQYAAWQQAFFYHAVSIPTNWMISLTAVNNRVTNYQLASVLNEDGDRTVGGFHRIQVTRDAPYTR